MKKGFAFILLLCHMNTSMFLPQMAEDDMYDANGNQLDDINTLTEYIDQVILGNKDTTPEDEDDDSGQYFHVSKTIEYVFQQPSVAIEQNEACDTDNTSKLFDHTSEKLLTVSFDIITPPPDALYV